MRESASLVICPLPCPQLVSWACMSRWELLGQGLSFHAMSVVLILVLICSHLNPPTTPQPPVLHSAARPYFSTGEWKWSHERSHPNIRIIAIGSDTLRNWFKIVALLPSHKKAASPWCLIWSRPRAMLGWWWGAFLEFQNHRQGGQKSPACHLQLSGHLGGFTRCWFWLHGCWIWRVDWFAVGLLGNGLIDASMGEGNNGLHRLCDTVSANKCEKMKAHNPLSESMYWSDTWN